MLWLVQLQESVNPQGDGLVQSQSVYMVCFKLSIKSFYFGGKLIIVTFKLIRFAIFISVPFKL